MINPNIPTDNLYKFLALSGLTVFIFGMYIGISTYKEQKKRWLDHYTEYVLIAEELDWIERDLSILESRQKEADIGQPNNLTEEDNKTTIEDIKKTPSKYVEILSANLSKIKDKVKNISEKFISSTHEHTYLEMEDNWVNFIVIASVIISLCGLVVSIIGFRLWYVRVQVHLDKKVGDATG